MIPQEQQPEENNVAPELIAQAPEKPQEDDTITFPNGRKYKKNILNTKMMYRM